ncbi:MAG TPA: CBS domain-containing protein, partial [Croceibacterium sp.]
MTIARLIAGRDQQIVHCSPQETVRDAAQRLAENRIGAMPVLDDDRVAGIFSERDLLYCVARH